MSYHIGDNSSNNNINNNNNNSNNNEIDSVAEYTSDDGLESNYSAIDPYPNSLFYQPPILSTHRRRFMKHNNHFSSPATTTRHGKHEKALKSNSNLLYSQHSRLTSSTLTGKGGKLLQAQLEKYNAAASAVGDGWFTNYLTSMILPEQDTSIELSKKESKTDRITRSKRMNKVGDGTSSSMKVDNRDRNSSDNKAVKSSPTDGRSHSRNNRVGGGGSVQGGEDRSLSQGTPSTQGKQSFADGSNFRYRSPRKLSSPRKNQSSLSLPPPPKLEGKGIVLLEQVLNINP